MYKAGDRYTEENPSTGEMVTYEVIDVTEETMPDGTVVTSYTSERVVA